jgi:hypothetical protein
MHFYCPLCHSPVMDSLSDESNSRWNKIKRIGSHVLTILLLSVMVGGSVFVARAIKWKELIDGFKEVATPGAVENEKPRRRKGASNSTPGKVPTVSDESADKRKAGGRQTSDREKSR